MYLNRKYSQMELKMKLWQIRQKSLAIQQALRRNADKNDGINRPAKTTSYSTLLATCA